MRGVDFTFEPRLDPRHAHLIWDVFFAERNRGLDLRLHFPWLGRTEGALYAGLRDGGHWLAGLCVRPLSTSVANAAAVGLVCVRAELRSQGLGRQLLDASLAALDDRRVDALTLWTGKPEVYRSHGFETDDASLLIHVDGVEPVARAPFEETSWPASTDTRGLPPFALGARCLRRGHANAIVLRDPFGDAVAEWQGPDDAVSELLAAAMPRQWRLHATNDDSLPAALRERGARLRSEPSRLQMWRWRAGQQRRAMPTLRLLDRI